MDSAQAEAVEKGTHKGMLDPFLPIKEDELKHIETLLAEIHKQFINAVKAGRGDKLKPSLEDLFTGKIWTGKRGKELGLVDELGSIEHVAKYVVKAEKIVDFTRNIIWDSYGTFLSPSDRYHSHTFIVQVKVKDVDRLKYLEVQYDPYEKKVTGNFQWIPEDEEFYLVDEQVEEQKLLPNLKELEISNMQNTIQYMPKSVHFFYPT